MLSITLFNDRVMLTYGFLAVWSIFGTPQKTGRSDAGKIVDT
jgi:hypothetical protein